MNDKREIAYMFIKYIHQAMLNEKLNYIRSCKRKGITTLYDDNLLVNLEYQNDKILEQISENKFLEIEEYVNDIDLSNALSKLSNREKYIIYKRYVEGIKDPGIAKKLGISSQAVSKQSRKAMDKLKKYFRSKK